ncbi:MAG: hypothetical protein V3V13_09735 [Paracoccaceae bacterium]
MPLLEFPDDMYVLRPGEPAMYGFDPMVKRYAEHLKAFMGEDEWLVRRDKIAHFFYQSLVGETVDSSGKGQFFNNKDQFGWYLFLAEAFNDHPQNYEVIYGSRVIPIFATLGRNLDQLLSVEGYETRLRRLMSSDRSQPNGGFFEFLVATAYVCDGYKVAFHPEKRGIARSHDIDVQKGDVCFAVECKRMEGGEYHEIERQRMRDLWQPACMLQVSTGNSSYFDIHFKIALPDVSNNYLYEKARQFVDSGKDNLLFDDNTARGIIRELDIKPLQEALKETYWLHPGPQFTEKLLGSYRRYDSHLAVQKIRYASNPHFIDEIDQAVVARWTSLSEVAIERKARDVFSKVVDACKQLPSDVPGIVHVGFETLGGDEIEKRRYQKIKSKIRNFDAKGKPLTAIICHAFSPEASPTETWAFDETCIYQCFGYNTLPLSKITLVVPDDGPLNDGVHW